MSMSKYLFCFALVVNFKTMLCSITPLERIVMLLNHTLRFDGNAAR